MHYAILNGSGNVLEWFTDEQAGKDALAEMLADSPDADLDLVAFSGPGRPAEPITASVRSGWPVARLVWSNRTLSGITQTVGNVIIRSPSAVNTTDDRVEIGEPS